MPRAEEYASLLNAARAQGRSISTWLRSFTCIYDDYISEDQVEAQYADAVTTILVRATRLTSLRFITLLTTGMLLAAGLSCGDTLLSLELDLNNKDYQPLTLPPSLADLSAFKHLKTLVVRTKEPLDLPACTEWNLPHLRRLVWDEYPMALRVKMHRPDNPVTQITPLLARSFLPALRKLVLNANFNGQLDQLATFFMRHPHVKDVSLQLSAATYPHILPLLPASIIDVTDWESAEHPEELLRLLPASVCCLRIPLEGKPTTGWPKLSHCNTSKLQKHLREQSTRIKGVHIQGFHVHRKEFSWHVEDSHSARYVEFAIQLARRRGVDTYDTQGKTLLEYFPGQKGPILSHSHVDLQYHVDI
jgi:hypothetical protein